MFVKLIDDPGLSGKSQVKCTRQRARKPFGPRLEANLKSGPFYCTHKILSGLHELGLVDTCVVCVSTYIRPRPLQLYRGLINAGRSVKNM